MKLEQELALSNAIANIYKHAQDNDANTFRERCFDTIKDFISFDAAVWVTRRDHQVAASQADTFTYNLPLDFMENYNQTVASELSIDDPLASKASKNLGQPILISSIWPSHQAFIESSVYQYHCKKYQLEEAICSIFLSQPNKHFNIISLYQIGRYEPYTNEDVKVKKLLLPHLVAAMRLNILASFNRGWLYRNSHRAVCDIDGYVLEAEEGFSQLAEKFNLLSEGKYLLPVLEEDSSLIIQPVAGLTA